MEKEGNILESAWDWLSPFGMELLIHRRYRAGFWNGNLLMLASFLSGVAWYWFRLPYLESKITLSGFFFLIALWLCGSLMVVNTDITDQEEGRFSKWGSIWDQFGDNYLSNQIGKFFTWLSIIGCLAIGGYLALAKEPAPVASVKARQEVLPGHKIAAHSVAKRSAVVHNNSAHHNSTTHNSPAHSSQVHSSRTGSHGSTNSPENSREFKE